MKESFKVLHKFGYALSISGLMGNVFSATLNLTKELNVSAFASGIFGANLPLRLPPLVETKVKLINYNCSEGSFTLMTLPGSRNIPLVHNILELSSVSLSITIISTQSNGLTSSLLFHGLWAIGSIRLNTTVDTTESGQWQIKINFTSFNLSTFIKVMNIELGPFLSSVSKNLSFSLDGINGTVYSPGGSPTVVIEMRGMITIGKLRIGACIIICKSMQFHSPQLLLLSDCCSSNRNDLNLPLANVVKQLLNVDIGSIRYFGQLEMRGFRLIIPSLNWNASKEICKSRVCNNIEEAEGATFVFKTNFRHCPEVSVAIMIINSDGNFSFKVIPIGNSLNVRHLLSTILSNSPDFPLSGDLNKIKVLDLNIKEFSLNFRQRFLNITAEYGTRVSIFNGLLITEHIIVSLTFNIASSQIAISLSGQFHVAGLVVHAVITVDTAENSFQLIAKAPEVCLTSIIAALRIRIPHFMLKIFQLQGICIRNAFFVIDSQSTCLCFGGTVTIFSSDIYFFVCIDLDDNFIIGLQAVDFSLAELLVQLVGSRARQIGLLNQRATISILYSPFAVDVSNVLPLLNSHIPNLELNEQSNEADIALFAKTRWPDSCNTNPFCRFLKRILGNEDLLFYIFYRNIPSRVCIEMKFPDFEIAPALVLPGPVLGIKFPLPQPPHISTTLSASFRMFQLHLTVSVEFNLVPFSIKMELSTKECFWILNIIHFCNLLTSVTINPSPTPISGFAFGVDSKLGFKGCTQIELRAIVGYNQLDVTDNYFYVHTTSYFTLSGLLRAFCNRASLPNALLNTGFPHGFTASYSVVRRYLSHFSLTIPAGFYVNGTINIFGFSVDAEIKYTPPVNFYMKFRLPRISLYGDRLVMSESRNVRDRGPFVEATISLFSVNMKASLYVSVLGISTEATLIISKRELSITISGSLFGRFQASLSISGDYRPDVSIFAISFTVTATLKSDFFDFVSRKVKENANGIKKAADALIAPLERGIVAAQRVFDLAQGKVQRAANSVREEERKVSNGRSKVNNIRNKINSVCSIRSCGSVSVRFPCGVSCSRWRCSTKYCHRSVTNPACLLANKGCNALKATWRALLAPAELALRGYEALLSTAQRLLREAESALTAATSSLNRAKDALKRAKGQLGDKLNVVAAILQRGIDGLFSIHSVTLKIPLYLPLGGTFGASIDMTIVGRRITESLRINVLNPVALVDYAINYIRRRFSAGRKKRYEHNWHLNTSSRRFYLPNVNSHFQNVSKRSMFKVKRLAELCKKHGTPFPRTL
jgi:hypothetical protein